MLNLYAGVHLDEIKLIVFVQKFKGAGATILNFAARLGATLANTFDQFAGNTRGRSLFDYFLMATLHRTIALAQPDCVAPPVCQHLNFDVARIFKKLFEVDLGVVKRRARFRFSHCHRTEQSGLSVHHTHASTTTTTCRLDNDWVANLRGQAKNFSGVLG